MNPDLPEPDTPSVAASSIVVRSQLEAMRNPCRTVIYHSLSCLLWFAIVADIDSARRPARLLLVSPPDPHQIPPEGSDFISRSSPRGGHRIGDRGGPDRLFRRDPCNPTGAPRMYGEPIGCPVEVLDGAGHITPDSGFGAWPSLEAWCLRERANLNDDG